MTRSFPALCLLAVLLMVGKSSASTPVPQAKLEPFLKTYCFGCHGPEKQKGQVRFDQAPWKITTNDEAQRWQDVLDQLNGGDMPPEDEPQPTKDEMSAALDALTKSLLQARRRLTDHGGEIKLRRLNQREYSNTIRDLFGFDVPFEVIPENGESESFDTVGEEQFFTSRHFDKYLELGREVSAEAWKWSGARKREHFVQRVEPETRPNKRLKEQLADFEEKERLFKAGKNWKEIGFEDEGQMKIFFSQRRAKEEAPRSYLALPHSKTGLYLTNITNTTTWASINRHVDIRAEYVLRIHGGLVGEPHPVRRIVRINDQHGPRSSAGLLGSPEKPESIELRLRPSMGRFALNLKVMENSPDYLLGNSGLFERHLKKLQGSADPLTALWIDWLELEGPYYPEQPSFLESLLRPEGLASPQRSRYLRDENANELIERFVYEAFRHRRPEAAYLKKLQALFHEQRAAGAKFEKAMSEIFALVLASPSFLYLQEAPAEKDKNHRNLDNRELAVRLAYFLWSSPPDRQLYDADLLHPQTLQAQVDRMIADPRAVSFRDGFMSQWAEFDRLDAITIDEKEYPSFNAGVRQAAEEEVLEYFGVLLEENLPASQLIDSNFVTINAALGIHYDLPHPPIRDGSFQKVTLPAESPRGGLMTQAAFLITGSNGERSSPVIRGALVMEKLLHDKPAPPPPNVPELGSADGVARSNREMVQRHQEQAVCASCHKKMDVIGFGLENFDTIGRWRDTELVGKKELPIDPGGTLPGGKSFQDVQQLKRALVENEEALARELAESMLAYGLGRTIEFSDADDVDNILRKLKKDHYPLRSMLREVALSPLFLRK